MAIGKGPYHKRIRRCAVHLWGALIRIPHCAEPGGRCSRRPSLYFLAVILRGVSNFVFNVPRVTVPVPPSVAIEPLRLGAVHRSVPGVVRKVPPARIPRAVFPGLGYAIARSRRAHRGGRAGRPVPPPSGEHAVLHAVRGRRGEEGLGGGVLLCLLCVCCHHTSSTSTSANASPAVRMRRLSREPAGGTTGRREVRLLMRMRERVGGAVAGTNVIPCRVRGPARGVRGRGWNHSYYRSYWSLSIVHTGGAVVRETVPVTEGPVPVLRARARGRRPRVSRSERALFEEGTRVTFSKANTRNRGSDEAPYRAEGSVPSSVTTRTQLSTRAGVPKHAKRIPQPGGHAPREVGEEPRGIWRSKTGFLCAADFCA